MLNFEKAHNHELTTRHQNLKINATFENGIHNNLASTLNIQKVAQNY